MWSRCSMWTRRSALRSRCARPRTRQWSWRRGASCSTTSWPIPARRSATASTKRWASCSDHSCATLGARPLISCRGVKAPTRTCCSIACIAASPLCIIWARTTRRPRWALWAPRSAPSLSTWPIAPGSPWPRRIRRIPTSPTAAPPLAAFRSKTTTSPRTRSRRRRSCGQLMPTARRMTWI